jgi:hypothetical protein
VFILRTVLCRIFFFALVLALARTAFAAEPTIDARLEALTAELDALRAELNNLKAAQAASTRVAANANATAPPSGETTTFFGYGEAVYSRPTHNAAATTADLRRVVFGFGHAFDERTRVSVEAEWEHAVTSAGDAGETAIEQAYVERDITQGLRLQAGLFLIPLGILNERHEPPSFYGVDRNLVETAIIPTTWREGGLAWNAGITTGFDLGKWDASHTESAGSPLASIHQEMQLARASDLSYFGTLNYSGLPGISVAAGIFTGKAGQARSDLPVSDSRVSLWDAYVRWTPANWEITALYAGGAISNTRDINLTLLGSPSLVPAGFWGAYAEFAYRGWQGPHWAIEPFARYERINTGSRYADLGASLTPAARPTEAVATLGASLRLRDNVVFKFDYQDFRIDSSRDRFNLGMGYMY